jgi:hypothetical protein
VAVTGDPPCRSRRALSPRVAHLVRRFKLSNDPQFAAKLKEIVGLYINPPDRAIVLSVDEKSQIQALDRTRPGLPMKKGRAGTITHTMSGLTFGRLRRADGRRLTLGQRWGNRPGLLWMGEDFGCCASG